MSKKFYASALLYDGKLKSWKVSPTKKSCVEDFYKYFYYTDEDMRLFVNNPLCEVKFTEFIESETTTNHMIFEELAPNWFKQWKLVDDYKGSKPY